MFFRKKLLSSAIASSLMLVPFALQAEQVDSINTLTVTGILPDRLEAVPGSFDIVDERDLERRRPFTVKEALKTVPGINAVDEDSYGLALNIGVRGLNPRRTSRTLLMEDGMPLFLGPYGDPSAHYSTPLDRVERIEVVKGSGQILHGPQTVGGMINFVTRPVPTDGFEGAVTMDAGNQGFRGAHTRLGYGNDTGGIMIDALQKQGDGVRRGHDFDVTEFSIKGQLNLTDRQTLIAKVSRFEEDSAITETGLGQLEYAQDKFQAPTSDHDRFEHQRDSVQLKHIFDINDSATLNTQAYYADAYRSSFRQVNEPGDGSYIIDGTAYSELDRCGTAATAANADACGGRHRPRDYEYWGIESRLEFSHTLFGLDSDAVVGVRYHEEGIRRRQFRDGDPRARDLDWLKSFGTDYLREDIRIDVEAISYFAQNTFHLGDWSFTPGVRIEDLSIKTDVVWAEGDPQDIRQTNRSTDVLPGFGIAWNGIDNTTVFAGVHRGIAPPRPDRDLGEVGDGVVLSKTSPEKSTNWELGLRSDYFDGVSLAGTLFYTDFQEIVIQDSGRFFNAGESEQAGIELAGRIDFGTFYDSAHNVYLTGSYTNLFKADFSKAVPSENIAAGNRTPYAPRHMASLSLGYENPYGLDTRIGVDYISRQFVDGENTRVESANGQEGMIDGCSLWNASINYRKPGSDITLFGSVYNLTDREYLVSRVDGKVAGRQRQFFAGIRYEF